MKPQSLATQAGRALAVNLANTALSKLGTFAIGVALARILGPEEFGVFAVGLLALLAMLSFNELGVSLAIVRWPGSPREIAPTVTTLSTLSSIAFFLVAMAAAPAFCSAMGAPAATNVVRLLAFSVVIDGMVATPAALMQREFRAGRRMLIDQVSAWVGAVVSIGCALLGLGAISLAIGRLAGALSSAALFLIYEPVRFGFDRAIARRLLSFGLPLAGSSIIVFSVTYLDQFLVGSLISPVALGFYVLAFNVASWPLKVFAQPVRQVSPAAFARLQGDPPALRSAFASSVGLLTAITLPICLVLTGAAEPLIAVVYGSAWTPAAEALGWLGLLVGMRLFFGLVYDYFVVLGSTRVILTVQLIWFAVLLPALYAGAELGGIAGAAGAHVAVAVLVVLPLYLRELNRVGIEWQSLLSRIALPFACGAGVVAVALTANRLIALDVLVLCVSGAAVLAALAIMASRVRASVAQLRTAMASGAG